MIPAAGDKIYVPNMKKGDTPGKVFDDVDKRGGYADVGRVTEGTGGQHWVSVTNFGGMEFKWEGDLKEKQDQLKNEIGQVQAGLAA